jgi:peroxiredoxin Q/BCP
MAKLEIGDRAPTFELEGTAGTTHRLEDYLGRWVILAFYPGDFTPVCTRQFCSYRDGADRLDELGAVVLGISPQSTDSHDRFAAEYGLTVPLLADSDRRVVKAYGVLGPAGLVRRSVFIVDPRGVVRYRKVALLGLHYRDVDRLGLALERAKRSALADD